MTGGLSPQAAAGAWSDWAMHLWRAPGRQLELAERAVEAAWKLAADTLLPDTNERPFQPGSNDHRFTHPGWAHPPFR